VELSTLNAGQRSVRIDPVTGVPVIDFNHPPAAVVP
jgi:hypothetical protein